LFERGAFGPSDTAATAAVIRVYSFGVPAQALIGVMIRPYFSLRPVVRRASDPRDDGGRRLLDWYPLAAMLLGLAVTVAVGLLATPRFGALGLAAGNAAGITATAVLLLRGLVLRGIPLRVPRVLGGHVRLLAAAAGAAALGLPAAGLPADPLLSTLLGGLTVALAFAALGTGLGAREVRGPVLAAVRALCPPPVADEGKPPHGR
ncbi:lipid II flippase MurJ, partial [Kitasatospora sp. NPDC054939]